MNDNWHPEEIELSSYLDGELELQRRRQIASHLESCPDCRNELNRLTTVFSQLENLPDATIEKDLSRHVLAVIRNQSAAARDNGKVLRPTGRHRLVAGGPVWVSSIQAGLTVLLLGLFGAPLWQSWMEWLEELSVLAAGQQYELPWARLMEQVTVQWLAFLQVWEQPLPFSIPSQQVLIILLASGLTWLVGTRLLLKEPGKRI